jgi:hypothetical protein
LAETFRVAFRVEVTVEVEGLKVVMTVQVAATANAVEAPQVPPVTVKSEASVPVNELLIPVSERLPELVMTATCSDRFVPERVSAKAKLESDTVIAGLLASTVADQVPLPEVVLPLLHPVQFAVPELGPEQPPPPEPEAAVKDIVVD